MFGSVMNIIKGVKGTIVYSILTKWYLLIAIPALAAAYYFFEGLENSGVLQGMYDFITWHLGVVKAVVVKCTPHFGRGTIKALWNCIDKTTEPLLEDPFSE